MIEVTQDGENTFTISWDENDPNEKMFNTWTEEDFINAIQDKLKSLEELGVLDNATEAVNQINDHIEDEIAYQEYIQASYEVGPHDEKDTTLYEFIDQSAIELFEDIQNAEDFLAARDQDTEQSQDRTVPPPDIFPLFP